jgi:hypothetical protein
MKLNSKWFLIRKKTKYTEDDLKLELETKEYEYGFYTELESDTFPLA